MWGAVAGAAAGLGGSIASAVNSARESKKTRKFALKMRNTAYQATMRDMKKAGLNPILAYKTGPTSSIGASMGMTPDFGQAMATGAKMGREADLHGSAKGQAASGAAKTEYEARIKSQDAYANATLKGMQAQARATNAKAFLDEAKGPAARTQMWVDSTEAGKGLNVLTGGAKKIGGAIPGVKMRGRIGQGANNVNQRRRIMKNIKKQQGGK